MDKLFFHNGLQFECSRCSHCCRLDPGYVFLTYDDLFQLMRATSLGRDQFVQEYCRVVDISGFKRLSLREKKNYDCIMWEEGGCRVYSARPFQCRSYPFWSPNLHDIGTWNELEKSCPGVNKGRRHSRREINSWIEKRAKAQFISKA